MLHNPLAISSLPLSHNSLKFEAKSPSTRVILIRHGRSTFNEQGRYQGSSDNATLTEQGRKAACQAAIVLKNIRIDAIYTSPLKRAKETLQEIVAAIGEVSGIISVYTIEQLREIDMPDWEGLPFKQVKEQLGEDYRCWKQRPHELQMAIAQADQPSFFPVLELYDRAQQFWQTILPRHIGQTLLIVSHGGTNHALISTALGLSPENHHTIQQSNCGISVLEFSEHSPQAQIQAINLTQHLGETLPKLKEGKQGLRLLLVPFGNELVETEAIAQFLKDIPLNFSLSIASESSQQTVNQILRYHAQTVQLQTQREDFAQTWQRSLLQQREPSKKVITGLVVASPTTIQSLLGEALQHRSLSTALTPLAEKIRLYPETFSVLHYPSIEHPPILQALNFGQDINRLMTCPI